MTLVLHEDPRSGNCYKIRLTAAHLGIPLERRLYDIMEGETRTPEFLASVNANGRIPVLQDGDRFLPESNAACFYLADGSALIPAGRFERAGQVVAQERPPRDERLPQGRDRAAMQGEAAPQPGDGEEGKDEGDRPDAEGERDRPALERKAFHRPSAAPRHALGCASHAHRPALPAIG